MQQPTMGGWVAVVHCGAFDRPGIECLELASMNLDKLQALALQTTTNMKFPADFHAAAWPLPADMLPPETTSATIRFGTGSTDARPGTPFREPFGTLARILVNDFCGRRFTEYRAKYVWLFVQTLRLVHEQAFRDGADCLLDKTAFDGAARDAEAILSKPARMIFMLGWISRRIDESELLPESIGWKWQGSPGDDHDELEREERLLDSQDLAAVAYLWKLGNLDPMDELLLCFTMLLLCTGFRFIECQTLPRDCLRHQPAFDQAGNPILDEAGRQKIHHALAYFPAKGGTRLTLLKAIPTDLYPLVEEAVRRATSLTESAHKAASVQRAQPGSTSLGAEFDSLDDAHLLRIEDVVEALNLCEGRHRVRWLRRNGVPLRNLPDGKLGISKGELCRFLYDRSRHRSCRQEEIGFLGVDELLFVINTRGGGHRGLPGTADLLPYAWIRSFLAGPDSIFVQHERTKGDGFVAFTTRDARYLLNTLALHFGVGEVAVAHWMGRTDLLSNRNYMLLSRKKQAEAAAERQGVERSGVVGQAPPPKPLAAGEAILRPDRVAHVTALGVCHHRLSQKPCESHARMLAGPLVLDGPARDTMRRVEGAQLEAAQGRKPGEETARWIDHHRKVLDRLSGATVREKVDAD